MGRLWGFKGREEIAVSKSALGGSTAGDITVVITGGKLDENIMYLGCQIARGANRKVHLLYVIEVPRALPLKAVLPQESEQAEVLLNAAQHIAEHMGCEAISEIVQAREAGRAIVDEVKDYHCALLIIGMAHKSINQRVSYVPANALCLVWLVADLIPQHSHSNIPTGGSSQSSRMQEP